MFFIAYFFIVYFFFIFIMMAATMDNTEVKEFVDYLFVFLRFGTVAMGKFPYMLWCCPMTKCNLYVCLTIAGKHVLKHSFVDLVIVLSVLLCFFYFAEFCFSTINDAMMYGPTPLGSLSRMISLT